MREHARRLVPSPSMAVACAALVIALGGTSYAALKLPSNSVGASQIKRNAVSTAEIKSNAVNGTKVRDDSLTGADINESTLQLPAASVPNKVAAAGRADSAAVADNAGNAGNAGHANSSAAIDAINYVPQAGSVGAAANAETPTSATATATCPGGQRVTGGGVRLDDTGDVSVKETYPATANSWKATVENADTAAARTFSVIAVCVPSAG